MPDTPLSAVNTLSVTVGVVFVVSGSLKCGAPGRFADGLGRYRLLPRSILYPAALFIVLGELTAGALLLSGWQRDRGAALGLCLVALFATAVTLALWRGVSAPCLCFGAASREEISTRTLARLALIGATLTIILTFDVSSTTGSAPRHVGELLWAALILSLASWMLAIPEVRALRKECAPCKRARASA